MTNPYEIRIASTSELTILASHGRSGGFNRQLPDSEVAKLDPNGIHVIQPLFPHEYAGGRPVAEPHIRCEVLLKQPDSVRPTTAIVDFDSDDLVALRLPSTVVEE
jgi:hypothetical protein